MDALIGSKAHDTAWQQFEEPDTEDSFEVLCAICGEPLTPEDKEFGAEMDMSPEPQFGSMYMPICQKCSNRLA